MYTSLCVLNDVLYSVGAPALIIIVYTFSSSLIALMIAFLTNAFFYLSAIVHLPIQLNDLLCTLFPIPPLLLITNVFTFNLYL